MILRGEGLRRFLFDASGALASIRPKARMSLSLELSPPPVVPPKPAPLANPVSLPSDPVVLQRLPYPKQVSRRILWRYAVPLFIGHVAALFVFVPWLFSWSGAALLWVGIYFYGSIGINLCYHRLLTHRGFRCPLWLERFFVLVALCCMEDAPASWVAVTAAAASRMDARMYSTPPSMARP